MNLPILGNSNIFTHKAIISQGSNFTSTNTWQDFLLFGIPANHIIVGCKIVTLENFDAGTSNNVVVYVAEPNNLPSSGSPYVTNVNNCYGRGLLTVPSGSDDTYEYGSFRWFSFAAPGSNVNINLAQCLPQRTDAHDVMLRATVMGGPNISQVVGGVVEITTQYMAL
jgi:hypothetical protein